MELILQNILSLILFVPSLVALVILFLPAREVKLSRWVAFLGSLLPLALSIFLWTQFKSGETTFQFEERYIWYKAIDSSYHIGVDGLSITLVLLITLLTPLCLLASFSISERVKPYMMLFLFLETAMLGVFLSLDLLIFFIFWEVGLVPMYFLINQWGSEKGERKLWGGRLVSARIYASLKYIIFTMAGSLGLLLAIQMSGVISKTFDLQTLYQSWPMLEGDLFGLPVETVKAIAFWAFAIAFAIKVPVWPFHT